MNTSMLQRFISLTMVSVAVLALISLMAASAVQAADEPAAAESAASAAAAVEDTPDHFLEGHGRHHAHHHHGSENSLVNIGHDSTLAGGDTADAVVSVFGSSTSDGEATDVVSILGDTRVSGHVSDSAVAVLGNTYIDGMVDGDTVTVLGDLELGPHAEVGGDVVVVGGSLKRDPAAVIHGTVQNVLGGDFGSLDWLHAWVRHCLLYGRPLAFAHGLGWAWGLALGCLALYVGLALLFREGLSRCVRTFETQPGHTILAALCAALLTPVLLVLLCVTVIGIAAVPFVIFALICVGLFGKAVMLAWLGGRIMGRPGAGSTSHPALAVLLGGAVVLLLYVVPVLGFLVYKILGFLGLGAVVYTLILASRANRTAKEGPRAGVGSPPPASPPPAAPPPASPAPDTAGFGPASAAASAPAAAAPPAVSAASPRAGFWIRMLALLLDGLLVGFSMSVLHAHHLELIVLATYGAVMWKLRGSTIGGIVLDLHVVRLDGRPLDWETAIVRALSCFLSLAVVGLGFFWIAFDANHQGWHDKIAGTIVVRVPKGVPLV
jgi:uncharacterized RDD family membrane protein YckC/cytoskeletal protein CcmA (bactofilin family)